MNIRQTGVAVAITAAALVTTASCDPIPSQPSSPATTANTVYDFSMKNIDGKDVPLSKFKGKVLLIVNVASKCGNTPQYAGLEALYKAKKSEGFAILGFPANQFGAQEPGTNAEIKEFCKATYQVNFPMFSKIVVKGEGIDPLYTWLIANAPYHDDIEWNFGKFLVGRDGKVIARFNPKVKPDDPQITEALDKALAEK
ncbi:MAG TPA: glutathione peroxidase [Fimbriimonadaceae bacterium]|jgi:glutathione peroxidase